MLKQKRKERRIRKRKEMAKRQHPKAEQIALILEYIDWRVLGSPLQLLQVTDHSFKKLKSMSIADLSLLAACTRLVSATPSASHLLSLAARAAG